MIITLISEWFSEDMGYVENHLPKALHDLGCEVHVVTSDMQIYATNERLYKDVYEPNLGPPMVSPGVKRLNGFTLHRLKHYRSRYGVGLVDLDEKLRNIKPDIVYLFEINTEHTLQVVNLKQELHYKIYTESRLHRSVYQPPKTIKSKLRHYFRETLKWRKIGCSFEKCYPTAPDVMFVITKYFGQSKDKCVLSSLAVDTTVFKPVKTKEEEIRRTQTRNELGFEDDDIVCIYTGRFTDDKGPVILAKAIDYLQHISETSFKGLFIGAGDSIQLQEIESCSGCSIHPFVKSNELVKFYQAADIGVWPKQESTSQLDAASYGLPIIISANVQDLDRMQGNGLNYKQGDFFDLAVKLLRLKDKTTREHLGAIGSDKINRFYSWARIPGIKAQIVIASKKYKYVSSF
jgi:glycosyltransferase involved in cell wall biosynthesis